MDVTVRQNVDVPDGLPIPATCFSCRDKGALTIQATQRRNGCGDFSGLLQSNVDIWILLG